ncbi:MAG TPA: DedA family protein [Candidatus Dormibacteraeota bacterium]|nr:DedA family protein [Candidatus Dormibacteraeota bacterium]
MNWTDVVDALAIPVAGLAVLIEGVGVPLPGAALLFGAAVWVAARQQSVSVVIVVGFLCTTAGADIGYYLGFKGGRPFVERFGHVFHIRPEHIALSELLFARHGDKAILAARFLPGVRTWGSMLAGMARMPFWRFQLLSVAGGLVWATVAGVAGYFVGSNLGQLESIFRGFGIGGLVFLMTLAILLALALQRVSRLR